MTHRQARIDALMNAQTVWAAHARLCEPCHARQRAAELARGRVHGMCDLGGRLYTALEALRRASQRS